MTFRASLPSLLLLPAPPRPASAESLSAAYRPSLRAAILRARSSTQAAFLVVALVYPILTGSSKTSKMLDWKASQSLLAGLYGLIAAVCTEEAIPSDVGAGANSVDVRVVLVDDGGGAGDGLESAISIETNNTTVVDLRTFAYAYHPWNHIMHADGEAGYQLRASFLEYAQAKQSIQHDQFFIAEGGISIKVEDSHQATHSGGNPQQCYQTVCLGGTFDHLHPGHKLLLTAALLLLSVPEKESASTCKLIVGVTGDALLQNKKFAQYVQPWVERASAVVNFVASLVRLQESGWKEGVFPGLLTVKQTAVSMEAFFREGKVQVQCVEIQDAFGPTITDEHVEALVVSGETRSGGQAVNDKRIGMGWKELDVYEVDVLEARTLREDESFASRSLNDYSSKISSSAIRQQKAEAAVTHS